MKQLFVLLLIAALLVELRTAFRLAEAAGGVYTYLGTHEAFFGCLEFVPIVLAVLPLVYLGWTTGLTLRRNKVIREAQTLPARLGAESGPANAAV